MTNLPESWREVALEDVAEIVMGQSPPSSAYNESGMGTPFFQGKAEFGDKYPTVKKWTTAGSKRAFAGDILMSVRAPVGPTNLANVDCVIGRGLAAIRAGSLTNQTFLLWVLRSLESEIASRGVGTTFSAISGEELRTTQLPLPLLDEQERIVEILEEQLSRLESALASIRAVREKAAAFRRSLLHSAFSGQLTGGDEEWSEALLGDSLELLIDHRGKTPKKLGGDFTGSGVRVISAVHIKKGKVKFDERDRFVTEEMYLRWMPQRIHRGDVLLTSEAPLGSVAQVETDEPLVLSQRLFCLRTKPAWMTNTFLRYFLASPDGQARLRGRSSGTTVTGIRQSELIRVKAPVPPLAIQDRIVSILEEQFSRLDNALEITNQLEARIASERRSLLHAAFTGELTVKWREAHV